MQNEICFSIVPKAVKKMTNCFSKVFLEELWSRLDPSVDQRKKFHIKERIWRWMENDLRQITLYSWKPQGKLWVPETINRPENWSEFFKKKQEGYQIEKKCWHQNFYTRIKYKNWLGSYNALLYIRYKLLADTLINFRKNCI